QFLLRHEERLFYLCAHHRHGSWRNASLCWNNLGPVDQRHGPRYPGLLPGENGCFCKTNSGTNRCGACGLCLPESYVVAAFRPVPPLVEIQRQAQRRDRPLPPWRALRKRVVRETLEKKADPFALS